MGFAYLNNKNWNEISREERLFCAELYFCIKDDSGKFFNKFGIKNTGKSEVGFEVCFYRDLLMEYGKHVSNTTFSPKRTFDLAFFFDDAIYILEAKAFGGFDGEQLESLEKEKRELAELYKSLGIGAPNIFIWAIISSEYTPKNSTKEHFDKIVYWKQIYEIYNNPIFIRADRLHKKKQ
jgi:hypothetical protein